MTHFCQAFIYFLVFVHHGVSLQLLTSLYKHHFLRACYMCTECSRVMKFVRTSRLSEISIRLSIHFISRQPKTYIALDRLKKNKSAPPLFFYLLNRWFLKWFSVSQRWHRKYALNHLYLCSKFLHTIFTYIFTPQWHVWYRSEMDLKFPILLKNKMHINFGNLQITNKNK